MTSYTRIHVSKGEQQDAYSENPFLIYKKYILRAPLPSKNPQNIIKYSFHGLQYIGHFWEKNILSVVSKTEAQKNLSTGNTAIEILGLIMRCLFTTSFLSNSVLDFTDFIPVMMI